MRSYLLGLILVLVAWPVSLFSRPGSAALADVANRRNEFNRLLADEWEYEMRESPEFATIVGDYRYNDRWSDNSLAHVPQQRADLQSWLSRFDSIHTEGFPEQETLSQVLMVRNLKERIEAIDLKTFEMPIDQFFGAHLQIAQFVSYAPFNTTT